MSGEARELERQAQREVGARVRGELIDYRVHGEGGWTRYRVTSQWRRHSHIWWNATAVATGVRACLAVGVRSGGAARRFMPGPCSRISCAVVEEEGGSYRYGYLLLVCTVLLSHPISP